MHVINVDIQDNHEEATLGAFLICELCQCVSIRPPGLLWLRRHLRTGGGAQGPDPGPAPEGAHGVRVDSWLWAVRLCVKLTEGSGCRGLSLP